MPYGLCASLIAIAILLLAPPPGVFGGLFAANVSAMTWIKVFRELDVQNSMPGTAGYFTVVFPLRVDTGSQIAEGKVIKARF